MNQKSEKVALKLCFGIQGMTNNLSLRNTCSDREIIILFVTSLTGKMENSL
jgi:hypothetical protein